MIFFLLFIVLSDIQLTWTTVKTGNTCEWSCYLLLCFIHPGILLQVADIPLPMKNRTFLILTRGCSWAIVQLWWCISYMTMIHPEQRTCTETVLGTAGCSYWIWTQRIPGLKPSPSFHCEGEPDWRWTTVEGEHTWEKSAGSILRALRKLGRKWSYPQNFKY